MQFGFKPKTSDSQNGQLKITIKFSKMKMMALNFNVNQLKLKGIIYVQKFRDKIRFWIISLSDNILEILFEIIKIFNFN